MASKSTFKQIDTLSQKRGVYGGHDTKPLKNYFNSIGDSRLAALLARLDQVLPSIVLGRRDEARSFQWGYRCTETPRSPGAGQAWRNCCRAASPDTGAPALRP
jgi:hypothetical protein